MVCSFLNGYRYAKAVGRYRDGDYKTAFNLFSRLRNIDSPGVYYHLGIMYFYGKGVPVDLEAAAECFLKSAERQFSDSFFYAGWSLDKLGKYAEAEIWYRDSLRFDHRARVRLALLYSKKKEGGCSEKELEGIIMPGVEDGDLACLCYMAEVNLSRGVKVEQSLKWLEIARSRGLSRADELLKRYR